MKDMLARKLEGLANLSTEDHRLLATATARSRLVERKRALMHEDDMPQSVQVILEGFACRSKHMPDGSRQIVAYVLPGDFCDLHAWLLGSMGHAVTTLSECRVADIPRQLLSTMLARPAIADALWRATLVDEAVLREWVTNNSRRDAEKRIAHLICELHVRMRDIGLVDGHAFNLPLSQDDIADTAGLSTVHTNRCLQALRAQNFIRLKNGELDILDPRGLERFCDFRPDYLHVAQRQPNGFDISGDMVSTPMPA